MKRTRALSFWAGSILVSAGWLYACSSSSTGVTGGGAGDKDATVGDDSGNGLGGDDSGSLLGGDSGKPKGDGGTGDGGTGPCSSTGTYGDCLTCCDGYSDGGVTEFYTLQYQCLCATKKCGTASKCKNTFCADPNTTDAGTSCNACIDKELADDAGDAGCQDPVFNECAADNGCAMGIECIVNSACGTKP